MLPLALVFCLMVFIMPLALFVLPKREYSALERRYLAEAPVFSMDSGAFSRGMEGYLNDYFPLRGLFLRADAQRRILSGQNILDPVWQMKDGSLAEAPVTLEGSLFHRNLERLKAFAAKAGNPFFLMVPPSKGALAAEGGYFAYPDSQAQARMQSELEPEITLIPLLDAFAGEGQPPYYSTDPHWNAKGAYLAYQQAASFLAFAPLPAESFLHHENPGFYGTEYSRAALWEYPADSLVYMDPGVPLSLRFDAREETYSSLFFTEHLETADQYPVFLDGNHGLTLIENKELPGGKHLVVLKDSFGNSLVPLLLPHYGRLTVVDLRAYRGQLSHLPGFLEADAILAVYSLGSLARDTNFPWLR